uniref:Ig-like domain-containing protein n=1 Tax=Trichobilharzia regenti TaxID=157069 RepID=A0AA85K8U4_TRIRE|nr:unnamed protein product [Trichobilharzia regenti]
MLRLDCCLFALYLAVTRIVVYVASEELSVSPIAQALRVGESGIFECSTENSSHASYLQWILNDDTVLLNGNQSADGRFANENGILTMSNLTVQHSGEYQCFDPETNSNVTSHLKVYIMPSYVLEGSIVIAVNGVLLILFIYSVIKTYREQNRKDRMHAF